ncbi:MAG: alpha/beta hydrolase family protein, partial [Acidimicrobiales bacterium]
VRVATGEVRELAKGVWTSLSWAGGRIAGLRTGARTPTAVTTVDPATGEKQVLATGPGPGLAAVAEAMPEPELVSWEAPDGAEVHGRLWRLPTAGAATPPPLLVWAHGGPTDQRRVTFDPRLVFFLSRGWAVLHPDCRGTTGWGRAWAQALRGEWGGADVDDVLAGARAAVERGWGDPRRLVAMGGSAGGMTALLLLARDPGLWAAAVALYPVTDLEALSASTHRFEAHYNLGLVGPLPEAAHRYRKRSPIHLAGRITAPVLLLHGADDVVVPPDQSRQLAAALRGRGVPVEHHEYEGEGHGWRSPATVQDELERTAAFLERHAPLRR